MAKRVRVSFGTREIETAWCVPLARANTYRLDNILFLHDEPVCGDVIEAVPGEDLPHFKRIIERSGRYVMIVDYPVAEEYATLAALVKKRFEADIEGCFAPKDGQPGRAYLAVPERFTPKIVFAAALEQVPGLVGVHPRLGKRPAPARANIPKPPPSPPLFRAIDTNDVETFAKLTRRQANGVNAQGLSLVFCAVREGRTEIVRKLIALGARVNTKASPLVAAATRNRPKEAKLLLEAGAKVELGRDKDGDVALVTAAFREYIGVVRVLLAVPHRPEHISHALIEAAGVGNLPIVKLLVKHGADPQWASPSGNTALSIARKARRKEIVAFFVANRSKA